ncbi:hypothetical protein WDV06_34175, partial [Streptomyces racemochromogenes]
MSTRSVGLDEAVTGLAAGAQRWIQANAAYLDSPAAHAELPEIPRAKALLQLAMLRRYWEKHAPADPALAEVTAVVEQVWQRPDFPGLLGLAGIHARQFQLMYAALGAARAPTPPPPPPAPRPGGAGGRPPPPPPPLLAMAG